MVLTIGICDDNPEQIRLLAHYLISYQGSEKFVLIESTVPEDFLLKVQSRRPQLVFLDIDMGAVSGIQLGEKIKALYEDAVIVYITAFEKYALDAFGLRAFHYLLKPLSREKFQTVLIEALKFIKKANAVKPERKFSVRIKGEYISLNYSDIYYFEKTGHQIKIHTENRDILYYENLSKLLGDIDTDTFVQCHQGYIVNADKIRAFRDKTLFLESNIKLPVSRSFFDQVKEMLAKTLFAGKDER